MTYKVLARKYRPQRLSDLKGQEALVRTLTNAFAVNRIAHAFLLSGIRGVGKTTTARIIAKALNCIGLDEKSGPTPEPCGECKHCIAIEQNRHPDVIEMDAATHTSVNDIRELIDTIYYTPTMARSRIFIIDEVHMLSQSAFNALLKTLEEPPSHVTFIFATTEIQKIPVTILSRCQRYDLKRLTPQALSEHLSSLLARESCEAEATALNLIAVHADGSVRDSITLLDQALTFAAQEGEGAKITETHIHSMLGLIDTSTMLDLLLQLLRGEAKEAILSLRSCYHNGGDVLILMEGLLSLIHTMALLKTEPTLPVHAAYTPMILDTLREHAARLSFPVLSRMWQMMQKGMQEVKQSATQLISAEMLLLRCCYIQDFVTPQGNASQGQRGSAALPPVQTVPPTITAPQEQPHISLKSYEELVALCLSKRQMMLYHHLHTDVALLNFAPPLLQLAVKPHDAAHLPTDFIKQLKTYLDQWTGLGWKIELQKSADHASFSLQAKKDQFVADQRAALATHDTVQKALSLFPNAEIIDIVTTSDA